MKVSVVISEYFSKQSLQQSYLLCLALLNFEHQVNVVFIDQAFKPIMEDVALQKQWLALKLYGIEAFYQLRLNSNDKNTSAIEKHCQMIDKSGFDTLKSQMDLLL